jgi:murein DD-endopeptidase MepM/ murein hydrolase activator NlpD
MSYLFTNPEVRRWKKLFFLSFLLNIVFVLAMLVNNFEEKNNLQKAKLAKKNIDIAKKNTEKNSNIKNFKQAISNKNEAKIKDNLTIKEGDLIPISLNIETNFYSAFFESKKIKKLAKHFKMSNLSKLISAHIARELVWDMVLRKDVRKGDKMSFIFRVISEKEKLQRNDMPDKIEVLSIKYHSKKYAKIFKIYYFKRKGEKYGKYYHEDGQSVAKYFKPTPIKDYIQITALLGDRPGGHHGIDFKAFSGTPVFSTVNGRVLRTNWKTRYNGYCVEIKKRNSPYTFKYLHLSEVIVKPGQKVKIGEMIAKSGNTGKTTAPHLHFQINYGQRGKVVDPLKYCKTFFKFLKNDDLKNLKVKIESYDKIYSTIN